jgi:hypothetical protein
MRAFVEGPTSETSTGEVPSLQLTAKGAAKSSKPSTRRNTRN